MRCGGGRSHGGKGSDGSPANSDWSHSHSDSNSVQLTASFCVKISTNEQEEAVDIKCCSIASAVGWTDAQEERYKNEFGEARGKMVDAECINKEHGDAHPLAVAVRQGLGQAVAHPF